jgi:hypothetical protein
LGQNSPFFSPFWASLKKSGKLSEKRAFKFHGAFALKVGLFLVFLPFFAYVTQVVEIQVQTPYTPNEILRIYR